MGGFVPLDAPPEITLKLCVLGGAGSGKGKLLDSALDNYVTSTGARLSKKSVDVQVELKGQTRWVRVHLRIWDILGQPGYASYRPEFLQGAAGALIVCSTSEPNPPASVRAWADAFDEVNAGLPLMIVVNTGPSMRDGSFNPGPFESLSHELGVHLAFSATQTPERTAGAIDKITQVMAEQFVARRGLPEVPKPPPALAERDGIITRLRSRWAASHPHDERKASAPSPSGEPKEFARH